MGQNYTQGEEMKFFFRIKEDSSEYINMISIGNVKIVTNKINVVATENAPKFFLCVVAMGVEYLAAFELSDNFLESPIECDESSVGEVGFPPDSDIDHEFGVKETIGTGRDCSWWEERTDPERVDADLRVEEIKKGRNCFLREAAVLDEVAPRATSNPCPFCLASPYAQSWSRLFFFWPQNRGSVWY
jgi:hypothetical protein